MPFPRRKDKKSFRRGTTVKKKSKAYDRDDYDPLTNDDYESGKNSYSSITAATAILLAVSTSTRTTRPLQRTRMLSVNVISGGRVSVKSIGEPAVIAEST